MANLSEDIQCAGSDTRPPMLDKADFVSWQQRIRLYCRGKDNGINILKSRNDPRVYSGMSQEERTGIMQTSRQHNILQGLPKDIYSLINHYIDAKDIWDNVKMLLEGSELTKEDRESQLYDDFEHFRQNKGETIHSYYVRFAKLINDMRNIKMTMSKIQLNSKFVNNMLPEWGRFVTAVKLNKGLKDSNFDQLYAYLKQHEAHANENKMMWNSSTNPPNTYHQPHSADTSQSDLGISPTENLIENLTNTLALLTQFIENFSFLKQTINSTSSNPRNQATVQDGRVIVQNVQGRQNRGQGNSARGAGAVGYGRAQNRVGNANPGQARQVKCYNCNGLGHIARNCTQPKRPQNSEYFKDKMLLMQAQENGVILDEEQSLFLAGGLDNAIDEDVDEQPVQDLALNVDNVFQADDCDASDSVEMELIAQTLIPWQILSSADPVYDKADAVCDHHEEHEMHDDVRPNHVVDSHADYTSDSNMTSYDQKKILKKELHSIKMATCIYHQHNSNGEKLHSLKKDFNQKENKFLEEFLDLKALKDRVEDKLFKQGQSIQTVHMMCKPRSFYDEVNKVAIGYKNPLCLHRARQVQPALYSGHVIVTPNHAPAVVRDCEETLEQSEISRKKMHDKMKAKACVDNKVNFTPPNYSKENFLATFSPQKQLTPEQLFWSQDIVKMKAEALKELHTRPIKALTVYPPNTPATLVPRVLPTKSQVKINIFTLRQLFSEFDKTCKKRITPTGITEGERGFEQTKTCYLTEVIPFFKTLQEHFEGIQKALTKEVKGKWSDAFDVLED
ncbi:retrovirus-related pol polyprotein from transposon TNT 1-94 [Tanacetum coccineum]